MISPDNGMDLELARTITASARAAGADQAQVMVTSTQRVGVVQTPPQLASLRKTTSTSAAILVIDNGRIASLNFSNLAEDGIQRALAEVMNRLVAAKPAGDVSLAAGCAVPPSTYGEQCANADELVRLSVNYARDLNNEYPAIVTRSVTCEHVLRQTSFCNSNGVIQQESRGIYGFSTLFAASDGHCTTEFGSYGLSSLALLDRLIDLGDQRRRYSNAELSLQRRQLGQAFVGSIIIAPEGLGFVVTPLMKDITAKAGWNSGSKSVAGGRIASDAFSLSNRPNGTTIALGRDFDDYGVPTTASDVITAGRLNEPIVDYMTAARSGIKQNFGWTSLMVHAGRHGFEDIIADTERGVIVSGFAGSTARDMQFSGTARNCLYVEGGRVRCAASNVMISGDMRSLLHSITHVSREALNSGGAIFPYVAASGVTIQAGMH